MAIVDYALAAGSALTRRLPHFRGIGRLFRLFNAAMLELGAEPIVVARMKDGTKVIVDLRTIGQLHAYYTGSYDSDLIDLAGILLAGPSPVFLDVGANIGFYSVAMAALMRSRNQSGRVIAFEPFEGNYRRICENLRLNGLETLCSVNPFGLSDRSTSAFITLREDFLTGAGTGNAAIPISDAFDAGFKLAPIRLERMDDVWGEQYKHLGRIDLVKIDVEGHEDSCLEGARRTIALHRPAILMEVNKPYYQARNVEIDQRFLPLLPPNYVIVRRDGKRWVREESFANCRGIDDVFLLPEEKLVREEYGGFGLR